MLVFHSIIIGVLGVTALVGMGESLVSQMEQDLNDNAFAMPHLSLISMAGLLCAQNPDVFQV